MHEQLAASTPLSPLMVVVALALTFAFMALLLWAAWKLAHTMGIEQAQSNDEAEQVRIWVQAYRAAFPAYGIFSILTPYFIFMLFGLIILELGGLASESGLSLHQSISYTLSFYMVCVITALLVLTQAFYGFRTSLKLGYGPPGARYGSICAVERELDEEEKAAKARGK